MIQTVGKYLDSKEVLPYNAFRLTNACFGTAKTEEKRVRPKAHPAGHASLVKDLKQS